MVSRPLRHKIFDALAGWHPDVQKRTMEDGSHDPHQMENDEVLRVRLEVLKREHRDLDDAVRALQEAGRGDMLTLQRLKRKKLQLKDRIADLEDRLLPDIIA